MHPVQAVLAENRVGLFALLGDMSSAGLWLLNVTRIVIEPRSVKKKHAPLKALQCVHLLCWSGM